MQRRNLAPVGAPSWIELTTSDSTTTQAFYAATLGWEYESGGNELGGSIICLSDGAPVCGITPAKAEGVNSWVTYYATANAQATADMADDSGGQASVPRQEIPIEEL